MTEPATLDVAAGAVIRRAFRSPTAQSMVPHCRRVVHTHFAPVPKLSLSEWSDRYRVLSRETSAEPGQWRTSRVPYLKGIMDAISDSTVERIILFKAAQVGFTEVTLNAVAYYMDQDPASILVVQPNVEPMAKYWSKSRLSPMIRDCPRLRGKLQPAKSRDAGNTILEKAYPGGEISIAGANSAASLASRPIRILILDEIDKYKLSPGTESDPIALAETRTDTFWNRKIILGSTPEDKHNSLIEPEWEAPEVEQYHYFVPCPHCGEYQTLRWGKKDGPFGLKWEQDKPSTAEYLCEHCAALIDEKYKQRMLRDGEWRMTREPTAPMKRRRVGFRLNGLYSPFRRWDELAHLWKNAQGNNELLKQFVNERFAETWEPPGERVVPADLERRAESYAAEVPGAVGLLTAGVDVQADRLEIAIKGWGAGQESWLIGHHRIHGDPEKLEDVWARLDALLLSKEYQHEHGGKLRIAACMIDSGYKTATVYEFVRPRQSRKVWASKGVHERGRPPLTRAQRANKSGVKLFTVGTVAFKDRVFGRLKLIRPGPGYMHFCLPSHGGADAEYHAQFAAEKSVLQRAGRRWERRYIQVRERNEAIDLEVLALAALNALGPSVYDDLEYWVKQIEQKGKGTDEQENEEPEAAQQRHGGRRGFARAW